ncbi:helical backbone metal receptor [Cohaesibacter celericrescens]|uniref:Fe3+-siderophores ABC transporter protein n=1 Tax=Cohaesibacter celericrescens TaxID=2067669 RepID=A0A2N5XN45_9HYPH|nr:helical backbone metal receptor [Cohaesibacter celericrescens]PLW75904.1 Fe3+-siderophores ABC transporter protein [Cohaesibacter celericrescens]
MRVVSLVPSWTETLLYCGVKVVGRTRYCIHPALQVNDIPIVGGTKDWDWPSVEALQPDILILDREENARFMGEQSTIPSHITDITSMQDVQDALSALATKLAAPKLEALATRWSRVVDQRTSAWDLTGPLPGLIEWGKFPAEPIHTILYMIWKDPWIAVSQRTFIGSMLHRLGIEIPVFAKQYQTIRLQDYNPQTTLILFSSEPYAFLQQKEQLQSLGIPHAFVNGESFCWYGIRSLKFLEKELQSEQAMH